MKQNKIDGLPEGWEIEELRNIWEVIRWVSYKKEQLLSGPDGAVSLMRANNIGDQVDLTELQYVPFDAIKPQQLVRDWDSLICMSSGSRHLVWKSVMLRWLENFTFGAFCGVFRPSGERLLPGYVSHYLRSENVRGKLASLWNGAWISNIKPSDIEDLEIPLPPLAEQERIVAKLDGIFEHIDASIKLLEQNIADADAMAESVLNEVFNPRNFPDGWEIKTVKECLDEKSYSIGKVQTKEYQTAWKIPIIDQSQKTIAWYCDHHDLEYLGRLPVLVYWDHTNSVKYIDFPFVSWADGTKILCPKKEILGRYFFHAINAFKPETQGYRRHYTILKDIKIPLPPFPEQERIVAQLDAFFVEQKTIRSGYETKISELKALKSSILSEAFQGKI